MSNGHLMFALAGKLLTRRDDIRAALLGNTERTYSFAEQEALVRRNGTSLKLLRMGLKLPYSPPRRLGRNPRLPYLGTFRLMAHLLCLEGAVLRSKGNSAEGVECYLDAIQFGLRVGPHAVLIGRLVGLACQSIGQRYLRSIVDELPLDVAKYALHRLQELLSLPTTVVGTLMAEKSFVLDVLSHSIRHPGYIEKQSKRLAAAGFPNLTDSPTTAEGWREHVLLYGKQNVLDSYAQYFDLWIERARGRYGIVGNTPPPAIPDCMASSELPDSLWKISLGSTNTELTQNAFLLIASALRAHRLEHGVYPEKLIALTPAYLTRIPEDPFAVSGPIRYRLSADGNYRLYSVGPDGVDDDGTPIDLKSLMSMSKRLPDSRYRGDIVAGINI